MLKVAISAAQAAAQVIREGVDRQAHRTARKKGRVDLVTEVDLAAEAAICEILARDSPAIPILAEERGGAREGDTRWIVDPLDGTTNFVHGFPSSAVSIALQDRGELVVGVVLDPLQGTLCAAARGEGATCNGVRLAVSDTASLEDSLVLMGFAYDRRERADWYLSFVKLFLERAQGLRRAGAAAIDFTHIAAGRADGYWEFGLSPWDVAAGALIVEESGGRVTDVQLGPLDLDRPRVLATNARIHDEMAAVLAPLLSST
jgi:myo-inositol-1(or 4)-monophosphatase